MEIVAGFTLTEVAAKDLHAILDFVSTEGKQAAMSLAQEFEKQFDSLLYLPWLSQPRPDLTDQPVRSIHLDSYLIVYRTEPPPPCILRVISPHPDIGHF
jgi:plasmid stabilization system protein ParE